MSGDSAPRNIVAVVNVPSPRTGAASAPVSHDPAVFRSPRLDPSSPRRQRHSIALPTRPSMLAGQLSSQSLTSSPRTLSSPLQLPYISAARQNGVFSFDQQEETSMQTDSSSLTESTRRGLTQSPRSPSGKRVMSVASASLAKEKARNAQKENDAMVYLDGPQVYTCAQCRTHLTSHDDIISKSFHGRHGRAYLFDQCVNVTIGHAEDRLLITGLHSVCDIFCKRCKNMVGWTYAKAYEASQKYKEGKYIIEKINLHMEESPNYDITPPAGERRDRWRRRSMSWGDEFSFTSGTTNELVYEYRPSLESLGSSNEVYRCPNT